MRLAEQLTLCEHCPHLLGHHGTQGCEHTPGYDDPYSDPATYAGQARDCDCAHPVEIQRPSGGLLVPRDHGDDIPVMLSPGMAAEEIVEYYGEDLGLRLNERNEK